MARKIFQQPNGDFAEYSTTHGFTIVNASKNEVIQHAYSQKKEWGDVIENILSNPNKDGSYNGIKRLDSTVF